MSYQSIDLLTNDTVFNGRCRSAATEQAETFKDDGRPDIAAIARDVLRNSGEAISAFIRLNAAGPGIGAKVDTGDGTIDQSLVTDPDLLALTQSNFPVVANLFYASDGTPVPVGT